MLEIMTIVVRNGRNEAMHGVLVVITGLDDAGELTFNVIVPIEMVLGPDEWAFGHALAPNLDQTTNFDVEFFDPGDMGSPVDLEVTDAELRGGVITGNIANNAGVPAVNNVGVHVACFDDSQIVAISRCSGRHRSTSTWASQPVSAQQHPSPQLHAPHLPSTLAVSPRTSQSTHPTADTLVATIPETSSIS